MNIFFAILFSFFTINNTAPQSQFVANIQAQQKIDMRSYLVSMASGAKGDPLKCVFLTSDPDYWKQSVSFIEQGLIADTTKVDSKDSRFRAYRLTSLGVSKLK